MSTSRRPSTLFVRLFAAVDSGAKILGTAFLRPFIRQLRELPTLNPKAESLLNEPLQLAGGGVFLLLLVLLGISISLADKEKYVGPFGLKPLSVFLVLGGVGLLFLVVSIVWLRSSLRILPTVLSEPDSPAVAEGAYRQAEAIQREERRLQAVFEQNLGDVFLLQSFEWKGARVFDNGSYRFAPRVNVLLGKNGYGKTLLLRSLAAMIQRDNAHSEQLFPANDSSESRWILTVTRNGETQQIVRDPVYFKDSVGKIPLLAIPDSRFVNRSSKVISASPTGTEPLARSGTRHFLTQEPYEPVVLELLSHLCLEYLKRPWLGRRGFDAPIFRLVEDVVQQLTDDEEFKFDAIRETGRTGFEILVRTSGSHDAGLPIQSASQGTLSVLAIFGLIYSFLESLQSSREPNVLARPGIVLIDEIDAHLHPSWQQRILGVLTSKFPNVQLIVSAHSPLIVAGCAWGEVSVLRRNPQTRAFYVDTLPEDFLGATSSDLYQRIFEISDSDRLYLEYATKATMSGEALERELERLSKKPHLSPEEEQKIDDLFREKQLIERAAEVREERLKHEQTQSHIAKLQSDVARLQSKVFEQQSELERLRSVSKEKSQGDE